MRFTSTLSMRVLDQVGEYTTFALELPLFVWLAHGNGALTDVVEPVFYVDDSPDVASAPHGHLLRGATEAACEEAWTIYLDLLDNGLPDLLARQLLPVNLMCQGTVRFTDTELKGFIAAHRDSPLKELAMLACGYEGALTDGR